MQRYEFEVFADYFQFYIQDEKATGDLSHGWTKEACDKMLAIAPHIIGIGTVRNMNVPVIIEIVNEEFNTDFSQWDRVNECEIEIFSGKLVVAGCTDYFPDATRIEIKPGLYHTIILYSNLDSISEDGLDGDDHYKIILRPKNG